ncbi:hypothetical protein MOQ72_37300 [Saccharopolyspora sp. K220]|uniref:hypothetical protein n=1 Tax=Saccharopolyspora soli TaxID=2926618 RepID=UPI001F569A50|nr:hypothetical protein [Saccharopolyspora soli]MCI2423090.1 hypothetical protein [Saccharopolyspora soli]
MTEVSSSAACEQLGWRGHVLAGVSILSVPVDAVVAIDYRAHRARRSSGQPPVFDLDTVTLWEWPEWSGPRAPEVVRLVGVLSTARDWRRALTGAARLRGFGPAAIAVDHAPSEECRLECSLRGVGVVVTSGGTTRCAVAAAEGRAPQARRRPLDRWVEECLYEVWCRQEERLFQC